VGFTLVAKGFDGVEWWQIGKICISWVSSPVLGRPYNHPFFLVNGDIHCALWLTADISLIAGLMSFTMYFLVRFFILRSSNSLARGFRFLPFFYAITLGTAQRLPSGGWVGGWAVTFSSAFCVHVHAHAHQVLSPSSSFTKGRPGWAWPTCLFG
jgi:phosphate/sulfate permease